MEEFVNRSSEILEILEDLSKVYLFGDIGYVKKNYQNWGLRDDNSLVILDYAYMYKITGQMLTCNNCGKKVRYNSSYSEMECPHCRTRYSFWDIRKGIDMQRIDNYIQEALDNYALQVDSSITELEDDFNSGGEIYEPSLYEKSERKEAIRNMKNKLGMEFNFYNAWDSRNPNSLFTMNRTKKKSVEQMVPRDVEETTEMVDDDCNGTADKQSQREELMRKIREYSLNHNQTAINTEESEIVVSNRKFNKNERQFIEVEEIDKNDNSFNIYDETSGEVYNELVKDELEEVEHVTSDSVGNVGIDGTSYRNIDPPNLSESPLTEGRDESPDTSIVVPIIGAGVEIIDSHHHVTPSQEGEENLGTGQEVIAPDAGLNGLNETNEYVGVIAEPSGVRLLDENTEKNAIANDGDKESEHNGDSDILCGSTGSSGTDVKVNTGMSTTKGEDSTTEVKFNKVDDGQGESKSIGGFFKSSNQRKGLRNIKR